MPIPGAPDPDDLSKNPDNDPDRDNAPDRNSADDFDGSHPGGKMKMWWAILISLIVVISAIMLIRQSIEAGLF